MEAKIWQDTVIHLKTKEFMCNKLAFTTSAGALYFCNCGAERQAEISFKAGQKLALEKQGTAYLEGKQAGMKEVVEWWETKIIPVAGRKLKDEWQAKLKEWGL